MLYPGLETPNGMCTELCLTCCAHTPPPPHHHHHHHSSYYYYYYYHRHHTAATTLYPGSSRQHAAPAQKHGLFKKQPRDDDHDRTCLFAFLSLRYWNGMVDQIRSALGDGAVVIDNGFYLAGKYPKTKQLAGADAWEHSGTAYTESVSSVGPGVPGSPLTPDALEQAVQHLRWIANASASHPDLRMIGHGSINVNSTAYTSVNHDCWRHFKTL